MVLPIVKEPEPILRRRALPVKEMTPELERLVQDMIETMRAAEGVGLAANQVGSPWNILIAAPDPQPGKEIILVNAAVVRQKGRVRLPEGCLSLPGISGRLVRAEEVTVQAQDRSLQPVTLQADGLLAQILQHETDHLRGRLYVDRLTLWSRRRLLKRYRHLEQSLSRVNLDRA